MPPEKPERRTLIADAALRLIGNEGARGLTHRAVDAEAGLPLGSTSYYCRRRADLLSLALRRHAELDRLSFATLDEKLQGGREPDVAKHLALELTKWMRKQSPRELAARFELFLACSREPLLKTVIEEQRGQFVRALSARLGARGVARPRSAAVALIALLEGLLLERVRVGRLVLGPRELHALLTSLLSAARR